jgi:hypothetical protein
LARSCGSLLQRQSRSRILTLALHAWGCSSLHLCFPAVHTFLSTPASSLLSTTSHVPTHFPFSLPSLLSSTYDHNSLTFYFVSTQISPPRENTFEYFK